MRLLIVEDKPDDAELVVLALKQQGLNTTWRRVETADEMRLALATGAWDAVLSDYTLPVFGAAASLAVVREFDPDLPFIVVSGTVGEDVAVRIMRAGANDYVLKHSLTRLAPALVRELREAENRRALKLADKVVRASEIRYRRLFEAAQDGILIVDVVSRQILDINPFLEKLIGYRHEELVGKELWEIGLFRDIEANKTAFHTLQEQGYIRYDDLPLATKNGLLIDVEFVSNIYREGDEQVIQCNIRDISARKRAEKVLLEKDLELTQAVRLARLGYWNRDLVTEYVEWSEMLYEIFGISRTRLELTFETFLATVHPDDRQAVANRIEAAVATIGSFEHSYRILVDGAVRVIHEVGRVIASEDGIPIRLAGSAQDITEQSKATATIQASEERYRTLITATTAIVWSSPPSGAFDTFQPAWTAFTGQTVEQHMGWGWLDAIHPDDREMSAQAWAAAVKDRCTYQLEHKIRRADGEYRDMSARALPILEPEGTVREWVGIHTDITDQKRAKERLYQSQERLSLATESARIGIWDWNVSSNEMDWDARMLALYGIREQEFSGAYNTWRNGLHPDDRDRAEAEIAAALAGVEDFHTEFRVVWPNGEVRHIEAHALVQLVPGGPATRMTGVNWDITDRKRAEDNLHMRDRAIQAATQGLMITDSSQADNPLVFVNHGFEQMTGYASEDILGLNCRFLQGVDTDPVAIARIREAILAEESYTLEILNYRKDGTPFWNKLSVAPVRGALGQLTHFVGVQEDVTARKSLEAQFRQSQKMDAFGQLAGGVAHDFNNLLTVINGYSDLLLQSLPSGDPSRELVSEILKAGERSAQLTRQLLAFSRQQVLAPRVLNLNEVVNEIDKMLRRLIGEDIRLTRTLESKLWAVQADTGQVEQVLLNLCVNARDAMPKGGRLTIETQNINLDENYARTHSDVPSGPYVLLSVTDTGSGMSMEVQERIFEPFFTTKGIGNGTGLGLATVFGIVKQSAGHIAVYSEVGVGTSFKVYLPRIEQQSKVLKAPSRILTPPRGTETILFAEDEPGVRNLTYRILAGCGYKVLLAGDGEEALRIAEADRGPIHLLISDVVMPGAGGRTTADQITRMHPEARVLYISGYTDDAVIRHGVLREGVHFLQKPFSPAALATIVREILDS